MSLLAAMLPLNAAAKVASSLFSRRSQAESAGEFRQVLDRTLGAQIVRGRDANGDGALTRGEFEGGAKLFTEWDLNADGNLTVAEIDSGAQLQGRWRLRDSDADGMLTRQELGRPHDEFAGMDADHDRRISRQEFFRAYGGRARA